VFHSHFQGPTIFNGRILKHKVSQLIFLRHEELRIGCYLISWPLLSHLLDLAFLLVVGLEYLLVLKPANLSDEGPPLNACLGDILGYHYHFLLLRRGFSSYHCVNYLGGVLFLKDSRFGSLVIGTIHYGSQILRHFDVVFDWAIPDLGHHLVEVNS
jgi:hypothetical protein